MAVHFQVLETVFSSAARERKAEAEAEAMGGCSQGAEEEKESQSSNDVAKKTVKVFDDTDHGLMR